MKPAINLYLATGVGCNVRCWSCPAGRKEPEPGGLMTMEMFTKILDKSQEEARLLGVQLYHYNEPTLHPSMHLMVKECRNRRLPSLLSTNLVVWRNVPKIMAEAPDMFMVSVSGFTQEIYERSHKDGDIESVKENMKMMVALKQPSTTLQLSWHRYRYNEHELPLMKEFSESLGFQFVPYATSIIPHDRAMKAWVTGINPPHNDEFIVPVDEAKGLCLARKNWICILQEQVLAINGEGKYMICSNFADQANIKGDFFSKSITEILKDRKTDPVCIACKEVGGHVYALQSYTRSKYSPLVVAEQLYRRLKMPGLFPKVSAWSTRALYKFSRPQ